MTYTDTDKTSLLAFAGVTPGLEDVLVADLRRVAPELRVHKVFAGAEFRCGRATLLGLVRDLRVAELLRVRIGRFDARTFAELERELARVQWHAWLARDAVVEVRVRCTKSRLWHSDAVLERVARVLGASGRRVMGVTKPDSLSPPGPRPELPPDRASPGTGSRSSQVVHVRLDHDHVTVSLDAAGDRLHRRGQRTAVGEAPLRETVAAALALVSGAPSSAVVCDPFCGSGVLLLESHALAAGTPARSPECAAEEWTCMSGVTAAPHRTEPLARCPRLVAGDLDARAIAAAQQNFARAEIDGVEWVCGDAADTVAAHPTALLLCNPPWGHRIPIEKGMLRRFGTALGRHAGPAFVLSSDGALQAALHVPLIARLTFDYRGTLVSLFEVRR